MSVVWEKPATCMRVREANVHNVMLTDGGVWVAVRKHSKRRNQCKVSYHKRIQKKWLKRWGKRWHEIQARGTVFVLNGRTMVVRRDDYEGMAEQLFRDGVQGIGVNIPSL